MAFALVLFTPGTVVLRLLGARGMLALGAAPALSCAFYAVLAPVLAAAGIAWGPATVGAAVLALALVVLGCRRLVRSTRHAGSDAVGPPPWLGTGAVDALLAHRTGVVVALVVGSLVAVVPMAIGMGSPGAPLQQWDAVFHLNGVAFIRETGDASSVDGLYGAGRSVYYPTVWHSMVALVPGDLVAAPADAITSVANASTLVMGSVAWLAGLGAFGAACFPRRPAITVLVVAVGGAFSMFPTVLLSTLAQWPNGLSVMLVPGAAALWVVLLRSAPGQRVVLFVASFAALVGVGSAHGSGVVGLAVIVGPLALAVAGRSVRHAWTTGRRRAVSIVGAAVLVVGGVATLLVLRSSVLQVLFNFERLPQRGYGPSVGRTLLDMVLSPWPGNVVVSLAVVVGAVVLLRTRDQRWLLVSAAAVIVLVALAAGPSTPLRALTGIWYTQAARIEALYPVVAAVLAAVGLAHLGGALSDAAARRSPARLGQLSAQRCAAALVVLALVASLGFQAPGRADRFAQAYDPAQIRWGTMLSTEELALVRDLRSLVPQGALVLGDPHNGAAFAFAMGGRHVVLPQLGTSAMDESQAYLRAHFRDIASDPEVCRHVEELGVTHFYEDRAGASDGAKVDPESPGLRDVDTSEGFTVVARAGTATLWTIEAC
ncbi:DUF6541 family protein [Sanguibacter sp. 25GB23B1]|uniref:DUF6541 family protein n=1 Tax=Sanguibacter sp. 25GB23B1 TaxID=3156067 RepID=UPI0032AF3B1C